MTVALLQRSHSRLDSVAVSVALALAYPAAGKFSRASFAGGRRLLQ